MDWILGNHADELVGWIPLMAARSRCSYWLLPCCFFNLDGTRFVHNKGQMSQYQDFLAHVEGLIGLAGFEIEKEVLRIPSTKNISFVGRRRTFSTPAEEAQVLAGIEAHLQTLSEFRPRISDREKTFKWFAKRNERLKRKGAVVVDEVEGDEACCRLHHEE